MKEITPLLQELASKLGTTVEYLWEILLKQAQVEVTLTTLWMNIGLFGFGGLTVIFAVFLIISLIREWDGDGIILFFWGTLIFGLISVAVTSINYGKLVTLTTNPEYWALQQVLERL